MERQQNCLRPGPNWGSLYDAPPDPGWGHPLSNSPLDAFGFSISATSAPRFSPVSSGSDTVGSWGPDPHFLAMGVQMYTDPIFTDMLLWPLIHSIISADSCWTLHAHWFVYLVGSRPTLNISMNFIRLFDCINCIKIFGTGERALSRPLGVHERERKKGGLTEGERWPQVWTPNIYDRSPSLLLTPILAHSWLYTPCTPSKNSGYATGLKWTSVLTKRCVFLPLYNNTLQCTRWLVCLLTW